MANKYRAYMHLGKNSGFSLIRWAYLVLFSLGIGLASCAPPVRGSVRENQRDSLRYVWIPGGAFQEGCSKFDENCLTDEKPPHEVTLSRGFWIGQTEVTVGAYRRFAAATHRPLPPAATFGDRNLNAEWADNSMPIVNVDWQESNAYCKWIDGRLPTEAQWEYAARAGSTGSTYGDLFEIAWFGDNSGTTRVDAVTLNTQDPTGFLGRLSGNRNTFHEVALKAPNSYGLYDMLGNTWEWTSDWYGEHYYQGADRFDPTGPPNGERRVLRGGSWVNPRTSLRASVRGRRAPSVRSVDTGFRCVR
jgi:formylglycine-generating enzyme required for sulfatase activity